MSKNKKVQTILMLDEIIPHPHSEGSTREYFNLEELDLSNSNVHLLLAVNPTSMFSGFNKKLKILHPKNKNTLVSQLFMRHRNGYLISIYLEHYKLFQVQGCLDSSRDIPLNEDNLPPGRCPVLIQTGKRIMDVSILELIKRDHVFEHESVTLLYLDSIKDNISQWCSQNNWKSVEMYEFFGCEDQVIVTFDLDDFQMPEQVSRAKNGLIIITKKG